MNITRLKVEDLRNELRKRGLDTDGTRPVLLKRLRASLDRQASLSNLDRSTKPETSNATQVVSQYRSEREDFNNKASPIRHASTKENTREPSEVPVVARDAATTAEPEADTSVNEEPSPEVAENLESATIENPESDSIEKEPNRDAFDLVDKRDNDDPSIDTPSLHDDVEAIRRRRARFGSVPDPEVSVDKGQSKEEIVLSAEELIRRRRERFGLATGPSLTETENEIKSSADIIQPVEEGVVSKSSGAIQRRQQRFGKTTVPKKSRNNNARRGHSQISKNKPSKDVSRGKQSTPKNRNQEKTNSALSPIPRTHNEAQDSPLRRGKRSRGRQDDDRSYSSGPSREGNVDRNNRNELDNRDERGHQAYGYERDSRGFPNERNYRGELINEYDHRNNRDYPTHRDDGNNYRSDQGSRIERVPGNYRRIRENRNDHYSRDDFENRKFRNAGNDRGGEIASRDWDDRDSRYTRKYRDSIEGRPPPASRMNRTFNNNRRYQDALKKDTQRNTPRDVNQKSRKRVNRENEVQANVPNQVSGTPRNVTSDEVERRVKRQRRFQVAV